MLMFELRVRRVIRPFWNHAKTARSHGSLWHAIVHCQVTILSQAFGDPYFQHHAAAVAASRRFKDSSSTDRRKLSGGNGQSDDEVKGMMSMQKSGMTLEESQEKEQDVLANIEAEKGETFSGYTVKMDSDNKQWGSHTAVCASVGVAVNIIIYSFE